MFMVLSSWQATLRVHPIHMMSMERRQVAADPQTRPNNPGCESACRLLEATPTITIYYYYSARKLIFILPSHRGRRLSRPRQCSKGLSILLTPEKFIQYTHIISAYSPIFSEAQETHIMSRTIQYRNVHVAAFISETQKSQY